MTEKNDFTTTARKRKNGSIEATIPITAVKKYDLSEKQELNVEVKEKTETVTTRRVREGSDTLEITLPKETFKDIISDKEIIDIEFTKGDKL